MPEPIQEMQCLRDTTKYSTLNVDGAKILEEAKMLIHSEISKHKYNYIFLYLFYVNDIETICKSSMASRNTWYTERRYRITGSRIYDIFTYKGMDWVSKSDRYFNPKSFTNKFVEHGLEHEPTAKQCLKEDLKCNLIEVGLAVVSHSNPWLGYSPDGIVVQSGDNVLLEVKCPFLGASKSIDEVLPTLSYLVKQGKQYFLRKKHKYYGQIQLGMSMLNLELCYFMIFCSYNKR
ncbi:hypothetical protein RI129_003095 [Pyrocoelia pectoralis]|uniref:YqaJ viral recombinase domain-containing protein n=1 Tax=Pyrocoelia pectoralis TaxID=417401 RepID=A0AAN7ZUK9_9COLE